MNLVIFLLSCFGATQILIYGKIFDGLRPTQGVLGELFHCSMCLGFHVGYTIAFLTNFSGLIEWKLSTVDYLLLSFLSSGTTYALDKLIDDEGLRISK